MEQLRRHLTDDETRQLVSEAEKIDGLVVFIELNPREGSGVIPLDWHSTLHPKGARDDSPLAIAGTSMPALRNVKALTRVGPRDYAYDVFWVVFPMRDKQGKLIWETPPAEIELVVGINDKQGRVGWRVDDSLRQRLLNSQINKESLIMYKLIASVLVLISGFAFAGAQERPRYTSQTSPAAIDSKPEFEYKLLATNRVSTMEKEMTEAASAGYRFQEVVSGETAFGGSEALVVMVRPRDGDHKPRFDYKLLATSKTSTMQKELQEAGDAGYEHRGQSVFKKTFGTEVIVILEREIDAKPKLWEYKLLATRKTSTMQKEVMEAAEAGYQFVGFSSGSTFFGGNEVVTIMRRPRE